MKLPEKAKKIPVEISRVILGCVFIFSGFVKAVDPLGSAYKFQDYFSSFGLDSLSFSALPASLFLSALEFVLGIFLLLAMYRRVTTILTLLFMSFMTCLTLYLAIANPVSDCGCFGDALVITNWETFYKNVILMAFTLATFFWYKLMTPVFSEKSVSLAALYTTVFILSISTYCYGNLPILDFRPYKIGNNIPEKMIRPEGAPHDVYETSFIYEKDGVKQEFTLDNYPADDPSWKFIDSKSILVKKGYTPPIHDFTITTITGDDITDNVLADTTYSFLLISYRLDKANDSDVDKINELYDYAQRFGYGYYMLTASTPDQIVEWAENTGAEYRICTTDGITLKTIVRSNPGMMLIKNGTIINKWAHRNLPVDSRLELPLNETGLGEIAPDKDVQKVFCCAIILMTPLALLFMLDRIRSKKKKINF
ncbi:MAG: DoxX family protein [Dysgonamonadaceae bacterium]|jgi:hypothetical protein|nr:DoxX family protein [Dysgonamonadaceae bacterium]